MLARRAAGTLSSFSAALILAGCATKGTKPPNFADFVWPPPPDKPRIQLADIVWGRADILAKTGGLQRALLGSAPHGPLDWFRRPFGVEFDAEGRLLVTDSALGALFRLDRATRRADVFGTTGAVSLKNPLGLGVGPGGLVYVADIGIRKVVAFGTDGKVSAVYGTEGDLQNPTDAAVSPDGKALYVADSKAHQVVVFDVASGRRMSAFGRRGAGEGEFSFPSSLTFDRDGRLLVVDQINARVEVLDGEGHYLDQLGAMGVGFANFVRPKDVAVDERGFIYVSDAAFANVQIFDADHRLLTFVGANGRNPGQFQIASGVAAHGNRFAVVDQLGLRVQVFRYLAGASSSPEPTPAATASPEPAPSASPASPEGAASPDPVWPVRPSPPATTPSVEPSAAAPAPATEPSPKPSPAGRDPSRTPRPSAAGAAASGPGALAEAHSLLRQGRYPEAARGFEASLKQNKSGFSVQILVACSVQTVERAVANVGAEGLFILPMQYQGKDCYRLAWGVYGSEAEAAEGARDLPAYFRANGARPRVVKVADMLRYR